MGFLPPNQNTLLQKIQYVESLQSVIQAQILGTVVRDAILLAQSRSAAAAFRADAEAALPVPP